MRGLLWRAVLLATGAGLIGIWMGYMAITARGPVWFVLFAILCILNLRNVMQGLPLIRQIQEIIKLRKDND